MKQFMIKNKLGICGVIALFGTVFAVDVPKEVELVPTIMEITGGIVKGLGGVLPEKVGSKVNWKKHRGRIIALGDFVVKSSYVAKNGVDFAKDLNTIEQKAVLLADRIKCLDKTGSGSCSALGCTSEEACIAHMLQALVELLTPIMNDILGKVKVGVDGKRVLDNGQIQVEAGAMLNLVLALFPAGAIKDKYAMTLKNYVVSADDTLEFIKTLIYSIDPQLAQADPTITASEKELIAAEAVDVAATHEELAQFD